jgi:hypothetical protein
LRPPKRATAKVYGTRTIEPTRVPMATRKNLSAGVSPYSGPMKSTITDQRVQIENPMCSESTENQRFRRATFSPVSFQKVSFSGSQCSIQRPPLLDAGAVLGAVMTPPRFSGLRCRTWGPYVG